MQKTFGLFIILIIINLQLLHSQPWHYDFGTTTGVYSTSGVSTTFLPAPPTDSVRIRIGTTGGSFNLENQIIPFGQDSYLRIAAPTSTSVNKFSVYNFAPGKTFTIRFKVRFGSSTGANTVNSGSFYLFAGDGACFTDNSQFTGAQIFTGLLFTLGASGAVTTSFRSAGSWTTSGISGTPFQQALDYDVEIYGNNSTGMINYTYGSAQNIASNKWDIWVNGILVGDDLAKAQLGNDANIDSWMFYGESSTGNAANIFLDEFYYQNSIAESPLPVTLSDFVISGYGRSIDLNWSTASEINNAGFEIERCVVDRGFPDEWRKVSFVAGSGTTTEIKHYKYIDLDLRSGSYKYRLKQIDFNGNFEYFNPENTEYITIAKPSKFTISQNYPNPSNPVSKIDYQIPYAGMVNITIYDATGKAVKVLIDGYQTADFHTVTFDGTNLSSGIYFYRINGRTENLQFAKTMKMVLIK